MTTETDKIDHIVDVVCGRDDNGFATCSPSELRSSINDLLATRVKEARAEAFKVAKTVSVGLEHKEASRIAGQIVADVCAQLGVRGSAEERDGADAVVLSWLITLHRRYGERYHEAVEAAVQGGSK